MASSIDVTKPEAGTATTESVRDNFSAAKTEIEALQAATVEGTAVLSTGEAGGTKFLREDGDGTCSWQAAAGGGGGGDLLAANNLSDVASAATSRTNLGLSIGSDVQAWAAVLDATTASFLIADETKLDGIEALADVTDTANVTSAGALMDSEVDADIKTLVLPASTTISAFGATLVDDAAASNARTTLGLVIGTDVQAQIGQGYVDAWDSEAIMTIVGGVSAGTKLTIGKPSPGGDGLGFTIKRNINDGAVSLAGGTDSDVGAALVLLGGATTNQINDWRIQTQNVAQLDWDDSAGQLTINTGATTSKVSNMVLTNDDMELGRLGAQDATTYAIHHADTDQRLFISGGSSADLGANISLNGEGSAAADDMYFRVDTNIWLAWDESNGYAVHYAGIGSKSAALVVASTVVQAYKPLQTIAATTALPSFNIPHGTAPSSPTNGDMWTTAAGGLYVQINGSTVGPLS